MCLASSIDTIPNRASQVEHIPIWSKAFEVRHGYTESVIELTKDNFKNVNYETINLVNYKLVDTIIHGN